MDSSTDDRAPRTIGPGSLVPLVARGYGWAAISKPAGLRSVPGRAADAEDSVQTRIRRLYPWSDGGITPHRLDIETSGLMVVAMTKKVYRGISRQFERRKIGKAYEAVVDGDLAEASGVVDLPLTVDWPRRPRQIVCHAEGRPARTLWRAISRSNGRTRVEFRPETGRTHQLRVHAATPVADGGLGAPILGDSLYGDPDAADRMLLHATRLAFFDPSIGRPIRLRSTPPF